MGKYLKHIAVVLLLLLLGTYSCELEKIDSCPCIGGIEPLTAYAGEDITLTGDFANFDSSIDQIKIGDSIVKPVEGGGKLIVTVPSGVASENVPVTINTARCPNVIENCKITFDYEKVTVSGIVPNMGTKGETITINGSNFNIKNSTLIKVLFGNVPATTVVPVDENKLIVTIPTGADTGDVKVSVDGVEVIAGQFTYELTATVSLLAGSIDGMEGALNGTGSDARFDTPTGIDVFTSSAGVTSIYVADTENHVIRKISETGVVSVIAGSFGIDGHEDSDIIGTSATFDRPEDVAVDVVGNIYVTESANRIIRKIFVNENYRVKTIAGNPDALAEFVDDKPGLDARFILPNGITVSNKSIFISDNDDHRIRKIDTEDTENNNYVSTLAGDGNFGANDSNNPPARFYSPKGLTYDARNGLVYVADYTNNSIRSIDVTTGYVSTIAVIKENGSSNDGIELFNRPSDVAVDNDGNIYLADTNHNQIKRIDEDTKEVTLVAGPNVPSVGTEFNRPGGIAYDAENNVIYIADTGNNVIQQIALK